MKKLYNPFEKYSETTLLLVGIALTVTGSILAFLFNTRFDGILDIHFVDGVQLWEPLKDNAINILTLFVLLYPAGLIINKKVRPVDILTAALVARIPYYPLPLFNNNDIMNTIGKELMAAAPDISSVSGSGLALVLVFGLISLAALVWYMALLYNGFKTAVNLKKTAHIFLFVVAIILTEALSSYLIYLIN